MNGGIDYPPKKNLKAIEEDPKDVVSGMMSVKKEGDASSAGGRFNVSEEQVAENLDLLNKSFGVVPSVAGTESAEISMEEVLDGFQRTTDGKASEADAVPAKATKPSKHNMKKRTHGEKKAAAKKATKSGSYEGDPHYGVPAVTGNFLETRKDRHDALREALATAASDEAASVVDQRAGIAQTEQSQRAAVPGFKEIVKSANSEAERSDMESKEQAYLAAYKELEQKKTIWNRLSKGKELKVDEEKVESLKNDFNQSRIAYAAAIKEGILEPGIQNMSEAFVSRMTERYNKLIAAGTPPLNGFKEEQTLREYLVRSELDRRRKVNSYITFREVVRPLAEKKLQARIEALDARGQGAFAKGLAWIGVQNQKLDGVLGKTGARAVRAAASTLVIAGGGAALGSFGTMGLLAVAGWGSLKFARAFGGAMIAAAAGEAGALAYEKLRGRSEQEKARVGVLHEGSKIVLGVGSRISNKDLDRLDQKRDTLVSRADESTLQKKKALVKALVAMGVGAGAAATLAEYTSLQHAADNAVEATSGNTPDAVRIATPGSAETVWPQAPSTETVPATTPETVVATEAPYTTPTAPEGPALHEARIGKGEGFNQLIVDLRASGFTGFDSELSASELSEKIGALDADGKSGVMLEGDTLLVDAKGNVWFERNGESQLLMENKNGELVPHKLEGIEMKATSPAAMPAQESIEQVASGEAPSSDIETAPASIESTSSNVSGIPAASNEVPEVASGIGRPLESFGDQVTQGQPLDSVDRAPEGSTGTIGRPLEDFRAQRPQGMEIETGTPEASFVNSYGVEVNNAVPSTYEWKIPGMDRTLTVSSGGSPEERSLFAQTYANEHPGTTVHFITPVLNNGTVEYRLDAWDSAEGGPAQRFKNIAVRESVGGQVQSFSSIDPRDFIRKLP